MEEHGTPVIISLRYLKYPAAASEVPRAEVIMTGGDLCLRRAPISLSAS
jgi:hypothetical protein